MSWGATAFTPIVTYNQPPFGFHDIQNPHDFTTCPENPYTGTYRLQRKLDKKLSQREQGQSEQSQSEHSLDTRLSQLIENFSQKKKNCRKINPYFFLLGFIGFLSLVFYLKSHYGGGNAEQVLIV